MNTIQGTNISPKNGILKMIFPFPRWDMLIPRRVNDWQILNLDLLGEGKPLGLCNRSAWKDDVRCQTFSWLAPYIGNEGKLHPHKYPTNYSLISDFSLHSRLEVEHQTAIGMIFMELCQVMAYPRRIRQEVQLPAPVLEPPCGRWDRWSCRLGQVLLL